MSKVLLSLVFALFALIPTITATDWTKVVTETGKSVMRLETEDGGTCTGFSIDKTRDYVLTAAHCQGVGLTADGVLAEEVWKDRKKDLMVLRVKHHGKPALKLAAKDPSIGQEVMSVGYGYALDRPMYRMAHISDNEVYIAIGDSVFGPFLATDAAFVSGQSGGPIVDLAGNVAMIVQRASNTVGIGVGAETMRDKVDKYFEKPVK